MDENETIWSSPGTHLLIHDENSVVCQGDICREGTGLEKGSDQIRLRVCPFAYCSDTTGTLGANLQAAKFSLIPQGSYEQGELINGRWGVHGHGKK